MDPSTIGWIGGIGGVVIGLLGGAIGAYFSIKNTAGPRERAFVIKATVQCCVGVMTFLLALWWTPAPYRALLWMPYALWLGSAIRAWNRRQEQIRREEASAAPPGRE